MFYFYMDLAAHQQLLKPRPLPLALKTSVEKELEKLQRVNVISPVQFSDWAAPVVPVVKGEGPVEYAKVEEYPLQLLDDLFASLTRGQVFT